MALSFHARAIVPALAILCVAALAGCNVTSSTNVDSTPYFTYTTDPALADSIVVVAGSVIPVRVKITHAGTAAAYLGIAWSATGGNSRVADTSSTTDSLGYAFAHWVVRDSLGDNTLTLTTLDGTRTFYARTIAGAPSSIVRAGADSMSVAVGSATPLAVQILDAHGNAVPNASVQWSTSAGLLNAVTSSSDANGRAQITFTAPVAGTYSVTAMLADRATVTFTITAS